MHWIIFAKSMLKGSVWLGGLTQKSCVISWNKFFVKHCFGMEFDCIEICKLKKGWVSNEAEHADYRS